MRFTLFTLAAFFLISLLFPCTTQGQKAATTPTVVKGRITDADSGEPIEFATVSVPGVALGAKPDLNGEYLLRTERKIKEIKVDALGYASQTIAVKSGQSQTLDVKMKSASQELSEVTIRPDKYSRKNNPTVELIELVIKHRDENRIENLSTYHDEQYEKIMFGLSHVPESIKKSRAVRKIKFLLDNVDSTKMTGTPIVPIFIQENLMDFYSRAEPKQAKRYISATKSVEFPGYIDQQGMNNSLRYLYADVDIYANYVTLLTDQFMSPIANAAPLFYRYYPLDTVEEAGKKVIRLEFFPRNKTDMLLQGELYIALDSTYAVTRIDFSVGDGVNLNWVNDLNVTQDFQRLPDGKWVLAMEDIRMQFGLTKKTMGLVGQRYISHRNPSVNVPLPDSLFGHPEDIITLPHANEAGTMFWDTARHVALNAAEAATYTNLDSLHRTRFYKVSSKVLYVFIGGYLPAGKYLEIGPMNTFYAFNPVEGNRFRFGLRTSEQLSKRWRLEGYAGYGLHDHQWKYGATGTLALGGTQFNKFPVRLLRVGYMNDLILPVQDIYGRYPVGSLASSVVRGTNDRFFYYRRLNAEYEREFPNHFSYKAGLEARQFGPAGSLQYLPASGAPQEFGAVRASAPYLELRFAPNEKTYQGTNGRLLIDFNYIVSLRYAKGISGFMEGQYDYHELAFSLKKYTDLPPFGYNTTYLEAGGIFGKVPYPLLTIHRGNQSYFAYQYSYNLMNFMEFISDRYASVMTEQNFNGFFLNKIPLLRHLRLREVGGLKVLYGGVSARNQPDEASNLYKFPTLPDGQQLTYTLGNTPYVEASLGVSNIFRIFRIDYIRRFTYLDHPGTVKWGLRGSVVATF